MNSEMHTKVIKIAQELTTSFALAGFPDNLLTPACCMLIATDIHAVAHRNGGSPEVGLAIVTRLLRQYYAQVGAEVKAGALDD